MQSLYEGMIQIVTTLANLLVTILPTSPFRAVIDSWGLDSTLQTYMGWLNWFFPVSGCLAVIGAWLTAYALFLLYSIIMRWVKMIGD